METRERILERLRRKAAAGHAVVGGGAGNGISAKFQEAGGIDLIVVYNSGRFRMGGHGSLAGLMPFADANAIVLEMGQEVLPVVKRTPVLAGICGTDPRRLMPQLLRQVKDAGFAGVQNFPTVGLIDGQFRQNLEETGFGYDKEVELVRAARALDLLTTPYVFSPEDATRMAEAGADVLVAHVGLTTSGSIGARTARSFEACVRLIDEIAAAGRRVRKDILVLCHGGPIAEPEDAARALAQSSCDGFYGASSMERLPTERAIKEQTAAFVRLRTRRSRAL